MDRLIRFAVGVLLVGALAACATDETVGSKVVVEVGGEVSSVTEAHYRLVSPQGIREGTLVFEGGRLVLRLASFEEAPWSLEVELWGPVIEDGLQSVRRYVGAHDQGLPVVLTAPGVGVESPLWTTRLAFRRSGFRVEVPFDPRGNFPVSVALPPGAVPALGSSTASAVDRGFWSLDDAGGIPPEDGTPDRGYQLAGLEGTSETLTALLETMVPAPEGGYLVDAFVRVQTVEGSAVRSRTLRFRWAVHGNTVEVLPLQRVQR